MAVKLYEAMFIVDASKGGSEFPDVVRLIAEILTRYEGQIERIEKWDERKFAYPIKNVKRGIYILVYFRVDGDAIAEIRRGVELSEDLLRVLILAVEEPSPVAGQLYSPEGEEIAPPEVPVVAAPVVAEAPADAEAKPESAPEAESQPETEAKTDEDKGEPEPEAETETEA